MRNWRPLALGLLVSVCGAAAQASPTGDTVYVSTINLPTDFGRPVVYDPGGAPIGWDIESGGGVPLTIGTPLVTNGVEIYVRSTPFPGIPGGIDIQLSAVDNNEIINAYQFEEAGDLIETSFIVEPATTPFSTDPFGTWGFLIEDVTWLNNSGQPLNLPVKLNESTLFLEFTTTGGAYIDHAGLGQIVDIPTGPHPLHPERTVIYFADGLGDLDDTTVYPDGVVATDTALIEDEFVYGILELVLGVTPITGFNIGQVYVPTVPGDANGDRLVDGADFTIWADNFGDTVTPLTNGDFTNDGMVDGADFTVWADNFGATPGSPASVPEPSGLVLAGLALAGGLLAVRRK